MNFLQAIRIINSVLKGIGVDIDTTKYDGLIVKKLEASNTLDDRRNTNQTHIAITGNQMDIFPYLRSEGYYSNNHAELKKYFISRVPVQLNKNNIEYLLEDAADYVLFDGDKKLTYTSIVRSRRAEQSDQIQMSLINFDGADFIKFRKLLHIGYYLVILKKYQEFEYEFYGVKPTDIFCDGDTLQSLNNQFYMQQTNTVVDVDALTLPVENTEAQFSDFDILERNVYGIHIRNENSALSGEVPHICIGWSALGDLTSIESKEDLNNLFLTVYPDSKTKSRGQCVSQIWTFIRMMAKGDYIVFGDGASAHIGRIISDHYYNPNMQGQNSDYVNNRDVEWLKHVKYKELPHDFHNALSSARSVFSLNEYKSVVLDLLNGMPTVDLDDIEADTNEGVSIPKCDYSTLVCGAQNTIVYGTPGCGKSYYVENRYLNELLVEKLNRIRTTFYQDYTNTDFVGQILPRVNEDSSVTYEFNPGPFSLALKMAIENQDSPVALIIEELNRGNAASIFGDIFQLLDRDETGKSRYNIVNTNIQGYLNRCFEGRYCFDCIQIPANLYIVATMNTSDQNVFTLDTAFKRRWHFKKIRNQFTAEHQYSQYYVPGMDDMTWEHLVTDINEFIVNRPNVVSSEDKQLGVFFIDKDTLCETKEECADEQKIDKFAYKLFEYLWDDVAKFGREEWFASDIKTLDDLVEKYKTIGKGVFAKGVIKNADNQ